MTLQSCWIEGEQPNALENSRHLDGPKLRFAAGADERQKKMGARGTRRANSPNGVRHMKEGTTLDMTDMPRIHWHG